MRADEAQKVPLPRRERERVRRAVQQYAAENALVPPLSGTELHRHAQRVLDASGFPGRWRDFVNVLLNNEAWTGTVSAIPFERRLLLLPQCLRSRRQCEADMDGLGLLCRECGRCPLGSLQTEAEALGYVVLIAEGTTVVTTLLAQGKVEGVVGVSCLPSLVRSHPYMTAGAVPGIAIPLYKEGCDCTQVDLDWVREAIRLRSPTAAWVRTDLDGLRREVGAWFEEPNLRAIMGTDGTQTEALAVQWLCGAGKRWRPLLSASVFRALTGTEDQLPECVRKLAVAVECFHKASLAHDDIEDDDDYRYGDKTLHCRYGVPIALNVGDLLVGEGYRLISQCGAPPARALNMLEVAAEGHRNLSLGQGAELCWMRDPVPLTTEAVIDIFRRKTAPAFEVALRLGAICAGSNEHVARTLQQFSEALGIAYQIRDDLQDAERDAKGLRSGTGRPSLMLALAFQDASADERKAMSRQWLEQGARTGPGENAATLKFGTETRERAAALLERYRAAAVASLAPLKQPALKMMLRRVLSGILGET